MNIVVYKIISPTNKVYIGISGDFYKRKKSHINNAHNKKCSDYNTTIKQVIRKYNNLLKWEIIDCAANYEVAFELEKRYILHFDSYNNGYNMTPGGEGLTSIIKWTKTNIKKQALLYKTKNEWKINSRSSYQAAKSISKSSVNFWEECTNHMISVNIYNWTKDMIIERLKSINVSSVKEWKNLDRRSYEAAKIINDKEWYSNIKSLFLK